ncbi:hypothetical protein LINPERPRIM_LOCUS39430 [Linum perenne]
MHYLWNEEFAEYYKDMGCKRDLDIVNPFVKLEVVPSTANPSSFVHLRCSYNNKFLKLVSEYGRLWVSATADSPDEDQKKDTSTLFQPEFFSDQPETVMLKHVQTQLYLTIFKNSGPKYPDRIQGVVVIYEQGTGSRLEFTCWESYEEKMNAKDDEIESRDKQIAKLEDQMTAKDKEIVMLKGEVAAKEGETRKLKEEVDGKDKEIAELKERMAANGKAILQLKDQLVTWESKCQEEMQKLKNIVESLTGSHTLENVNNV